MEYDCNADLEHRAVACGSLLGDRKMVDAHALGSQSAWLDPEIEDRVIMEPDMGRAYRAALFLIFTGRDVREVEAAVAKRENMAKVAADIIHNAGLRQADVAERAKVDRAVVSRVCTGGKVSYRAQLAVWSAAVMMKREVEARA